MKVRIIEKTHGATKTPGKNPIPRPLGKTFVRVITTPKIIINTDAINDENNPKNTPWCIRGTLT